MLLDYFHYYIHLYLHNIHLKKKKRKKETMYHFLKKLNDSAASLNHEWKRKESGR